MPAMLWMNALVRPLNRKKNSSGDVHIYAQHLVDPSHGRCSQRVALHIVPSPAARACIAALQDMVHGRTGQAVQAVKSDGGFGYVASSRRNVQPAGTFDKLLSRDL